MADVIAPSATGLESNVATTEGVKRQDPKVPDGYDSEAEFCNEVRKLYDADLEYDQENRREAVEDLKFVANQQWDKDVLQARAAARKPSLTINRIPAFIAQLTGNRRMTDTGIKIVPDHGGTKQIAEIREGLVRSIQKVSKASYAYDKAFETQVMGGIGNFQVVVDYAHDDAFDQDIRIAAIPNLLAVVWDRNSVEPTGADAGHVFIVDGMDRTEFDSRYPNKQAGDFDGFLREGTVGISDARDSAQILSYWQMLSKKRTIALLVDGRVLDVTDLPPEEWFDRVAINSRTGQKMVREAPRRYARLYRMTTTEILEGPYELPIQRVPVFRVPGWEVFVQGERFRWGLTRLARDPQKLHNFWRSTIAEKLVSSPKAKWLSGDKAVEGREDAFRKSHLGDDPLLIYNSDAGEAPQRMDPLQIEAALIQEAGVAAQDIKEVLNLHEANLGIQSNEVSGRAIQARQRVGELGTFLYQDNLNMAIEEAGKVINQLIPVIYDTNRIVKVIGSDMRSEKLVPINNPNDPNSDITLGKYEVSVITGPSYTTRRMESHDAMMGMVNAMPEVMSVAADLVVEAQDWPGAENISKRLRRGLPPGVVGQEELTDEERAQQQGMAAQQQQQQILQQQAMQLEMAEKQAKAQLAQAQAAKAIAEADEARARADLAKANATKAIADIQTGRVQTALQIVETLHPAENGATTQ